MPSLIERLVVKDLMTSKVLTLSADSNLPSADYLMKLGRVRHLPVVHGNKLVGLVTHRDILSSRLSDLTPLTSKERAELQSEVPIVQIMQREVWTVRPDTPALAALNMLRDHRFGCLPVIEDGALMGIVTEADFLRVFERLVEEAKDLRVGAVMTPAPVTLDVDATCDAALDAMGSYQIRHLPLLRDGKLAAVVSERSLQVAQAIARHLQAPAVPVSLAATEPFTVTPTDLLRVTLTEMADRRVGSALVVEDERLVGIITTVDVCRFFGSR